MIMSLGVDGVWDTKERAFCSHVPTWTSGEERTLVVLYFFFRSIPTDGLASVHNMVLSSEFFWRYGFASCRRQGCWWLQNGLVGSK